MKLHGDALRARSNAYAPYSKFQVGAALIDDKGRVHLGCNFENASYGAAICAERNAIGAMVSSGATGFSEILVVTDTPQGCAPCGLCRQVLAEFTREPLKVKVHVANLKGVVKSYTLAELLPAAFDSSYLK
jgi:cytidine deaminase